MIIEVTPAFCELNFKTNFFYGEQKNEIEADL